MTRILIQRYQLTATSPVGLRVVEQTDGRTAVIAVDYEHPDLHAAARNRAELLGVPWEYEAEDAA